MSSALRWLGAALALVAALAPRPAAAQAPEPRAGTPVDSLEIGLRRRIEAIAPQMATAEAAADSSMWALERALRTSGQDTVMVGPLRIVTTTDKTEEAERLFRAEWAFYEPLIGGQGPALRGHTFVYDRSPRYYPFAVGGGARLWYVRFRLPVSDERVRSGIHEAIGGAAIVALPREIAGWTAGTRLETGPVSARAYQRFVRAPSLLAQACANGSNDACWTALGDVSPTVDIVATWYTPAEQRMLVRRMGRNQLDGRRCLAGADDVCHEILENALIERRDMPYPPDLRATLLWFALREGGAGSMDRLAASVGPDARPKSNTPDAPDPAVMLIGSLTDIRTHLERASGLDGDVLIQRWREQIMDGRPVPITADGRGRASTMLWILLFVGLATRSTRWRSR